MDGVHFDILIGLVELDAPRHPGEILGCGEPIAAYAEITADKNLRLEGIAWLIGETEPRRGNLVRPVAHPDALGVEPPRSTRMRFARALFALTGPGRREDFSGTSVTGYINRL